MYLTLIQYNMPSVQWRSQRGRRNHRFQPNLNFVMETLAFDAVFPALTWEIEKFAPTPLNIFLLTLLHPLKQV